MPQHREPHQWRATAALLACALLVVFAWRWGSVPASQTSPVTQFVVPVDGLWQDPGGRSVTLSPRGDQLAYAATADGVRRLYLRRLDAIEPVVVPGTEGATSPVFSPDAAELAFVTDGTVIQRVSAGGGPVVTVYDAFETARVNGLAWGSGGEIFFGAYNGPISRVSAVGGVAEALTEPAPRTTHQFPSVNESGTRVLYRVRADDPEVDGLYLLALDSGETRRITPGSVGGFLTDRYVIFFRDDTLWFAEVGDAGLAAPPLPVRADVSTPWGVAHLATAHDGSVALSSFRGATRQLVWVGRDGTEEPLLEGTGLGSPRLSPDGTRIVLNQNPFGVVTFDIASDVSAVVSDVGLYPLWTPDGAGVVFSAPSDEGPMSLFRRPIDSVASAAELILPGGFPLVAHAFAEGGSTLVLHEQNPATGREIFLLPLDGAGEMRAFASSPADETSPVVSPDGGWIAFVSDRTGRSEVYLRSLDDAVVERTISSDGGTSPLWSRGGGELFYRRGDDVIVVGIETSPKLDLGRPEVLFSGRYQSQVGGNREYDVDLDGSRFLMIKDLDVVDEVIVTRNWLTELRARLDAS